MEDVREVRQTRERGATRVTVRILKKKDRSGNYQKVTEMPWRRLSKEAV